MQAIARAGLKQPGKSACFYCPSSKAHEILALKRDYPDLFARAVEMERRALAGEGRAPMLQSKGLGRQFSWAALVAFSEAQGSLFASEAVCFDAGRPEVDCGCYDGE